MSDLKKEIIDTRQGSFYYNEKIGNKDWEGNPDHGKTLENSRKKQKELIKEVDDSCLCRKEELVFNKFSGRYLTSEKFANAFAGNNNILKLKKYFKENSKHNIQEDFKEDDIRAVVYFQVDNKGKIIDVGFNIVRPVFMRYAFPDLDYQIIDSSKMIGAFGKRIKIFNENNVLELQKMSRSELNKILDMNGLFEERKF